MTRSNCVFLRGLCGGGELGWGDNEAASAFGLFDNLLQVEDTKEVRV